MTNLLHLHKHFRWTIISTKSLHKTGVFQWVATLELFRWVQVRTLSNQSVNYILNLWLYWSYNCMWRTTNAFVTRKWPVPQFYGKWPFERFLGMQEPASVVFSILNFLSHCWMIRKFRADVRPDSPMFRVWHVFCVVRLQW